MSAANPIGRPVGSAQKSYELDARHRRRLRRKMAGLPKNSIHRAVIERRMLADKPETHSAIAESFGVHRTYVTQIERSLRIQT